MPKATTADYLLLHLCIIFWGFTSVLGVLSSLEAPYLVLYRSLLSFISLLAIMRFRKIPTGFPSSSAMSLIIAGSLTGFHWITFFASARMSNVSTCLAGMSTTALWTSLLEPLLTDKKISRTEIILALVVSSGLLLIFYSDFRLAEGLMVSIVSALSCSVFTILNRNLVKEHSAFQITAWEMGVAFVFTAACLPVLGSLNLLPSAFPPAPVGWDWINIAFLAWVCTVFAYTVSVELMKRFTAFAITLTVNLEPVYGILLGLLIFGQKEQMQGLFYLGLLLILAGVFSFPLLERTKKTDP
jgi:drug/metabolite transporter (DMT)-like permease